MISLQRRLQVFQFFQKDTTIQSYILILFFLVFTSYWKDPVYFLKYSDTMKNVPAELSTPSINLIMA